MVLIISQMTVLLTQFSGFKASSAQQTISVDPLNYKGKTDTFESVIYNNKHIIEYVCYGMIVLALITMLLYNKKDDKKYSQIAIGLNTLLAAVTSAAAGILVYSFYKNTSDLESELNNVLNDCNDVVKSTIIQPQNTTDPQTGAQQAERLNRTIGNFKVSTNENIGKAFSLDIFLETMQKINLVDLKKKQYIEQKALTGKAEQDYSDKKSDLQNIADLMYGITGKQYENIDPNDPNFLDYFNSFSKEIAQVIMKNIAGGNTSGGVTNELQNIKITQKNVENLKALISSAIFSSNIGKEMSLESLPAFYEELITNINKVEGVSLDQKQEKILSDVISMLGSEQGTIAGKIKEASAEFTEIQEAKTNTTNFMKTLPDVSKIKDLFGFMATVVNQSNATKDPNSPVKQYDMNSVEGIQQLIADYGLIIKENQQRATEISTVMAEVSAVQAAIDPLKAKIASNITDLTKPDGEYNVKDAIVKTTNYASSDQNVAIILGDLSDKSTYSQKAQILDSLSSSYSTMNKSMADGYSSLVSYVNTNYSSKLPNGVPFPTDLTNANVTAFSSFLTSFVPTLAPTSTVERDNSIQIIVDTMNYLGVPITTANFADNQEAMKNAIQKLADIYNKYRAPQSGVITSGITLSPLVGSFSNTGSSAFTLRSSGANYYNFAHFCYDLVVFMTYYSLVHGFYDTTNKTLDTTTDGYFSYFKELFEMCYGQAMSATYNINDGSNLNASVIGQVYDKDGLMIKTNLKAGDAILQNNDPDKAKKYYNSSAFHYNRASDNKQYAFTTDMVFGQNVPFTQDMAYAFEPWFTSLSAATSEEIEGSSAKELNFNVRYGIYNSTTASKTCLATKRKTNLNTLMSGLYGVKNYEMSWTTKFFVTNNIGLMNGTTRYDTTIWPSYQDNQPTTNVTWPLQSAQLFGALYTYVNKRPDYLGDKIATDTTIKNNHFSIDSSLPNAFKSMNTLFKAMAEFNTSINRFYMNLNNQMNKFGTSSINKQKIQDIQQAYKPANGYTTYISSIARIQSIVQDKQNYPFIPYSGRLLLDGTTLYYDSWENPLLIYPKSQNKCVANNNENEIFISQLLYMMGAYKYDISTVSLAPNPVV